MIENVKKTFNCTILIVEQKVKDVLKISDKVHALKLGKIILEGTPSEIESGGNLKGIFLA